MIPKHFLFVCCQLNPKFIDYILLECLRFGCQQTCTNVLRTALLGCSDPWKFEVLFVGEIRLNSRLIISLIDTTDNAVIPETKVNDLSDRTGNVLKE